MNKEIQVMLTQLKQNTKALKKMEKDGVVITEKEYESMCDALIK